MSDKQKVVLLYGSKPKEDLKLPPLKQRPYEQASGTLQKPKPLDKPAFAEALSNIRV